MGVAFPEIRLGWSSIGPGRPAYRIAELACAHEGSFHFAPCQADAAAGADRVVGRALGQPLAKVEPLREAVPFEEECLT